MKLSPLTTQAKERCESCINLARWFAGKTNRRLDGVIPYEEVMGMAYMALVRASVAYDPIKFPDVPFSAYAAVVIARNLYRDVRLWFRERDNTVSLDDLREKSDHTWDPIDHRTPASDLELADKEVVEEIKRTLPKDWFKILQHRYLDGLTLEAIGSMKGITREAVRQMEKRALLRVKKFLTEEGRPRKVA